MFAVFTLLTCTEKWLKRHLLLRKHGAPGSRRRAHGPVTGLLKLSDGRGNGICITYNGHGACRVAGEGVQRQQLRYSAQRCSGIGTGQFDQPCPCLPCNPGGWKVGIHDGQIVTMAHAGQCMQGIGGEQRRQVLSMDGVR